MIYTNKGMLLDKVLCDVIPCVCPLIDHGSLKALEFLKLLYNTLYKTKSLYSRQYKNSFSFGHLSHPSSLFNTD